MLDWITCGQDVAHAALIVGYGVEGQGAAESPSYLAESVLSKGKEYFIIKNSWGEQWGEKGFAKILNTQWGHETGICGIYTEGYQPIINMERFKERELKSNA